MSKEEKEANQANETNEQEKDYEILGEDCPNYDISFKIIVIGNSGKSNDNIIKN